MRFDIDSDVLRRTLDELRYICPKLREGENTFKINDDGVLNIHLLVEVLRGIYPAVTLVETSRMPHPESRVHTFFSRWFWTLKVRVDQTAFQHTFDSYYGREK
ncbi:hypothetical protein PR1_24 [Providencia phage vB_PreS_PR1]|uniref:Uncharacterized protein n=1 Tax=Providencia phage vB_PreS_PR1 TaxID=1931407 RepID=A0A1S6KV69_9CAUD|nr:hypothetical protein FDH30_gp025 [Providencia phage vB_PreS_PR1]AQT25314.1 hypothetical protein PR1_24 [Providencia phage vB_PreS_PR1]